MKKAVPCLIILIILGINCYSFVNVSRSNVSIEYNSLRKNNNETLYVGGSGPSNYSRIQDAIDNANNGDTVFVYSKTYYENVLVEKDNITVIGENKDTTIIDAGGTLSAFYSSSKNVNFFGFTVRNGSFGIALDYSENTNISGNNIVYNTYGINLNYANNNKIVDNNINSSNHISIQLFYSSNNTFINNTINNSKDNGISLVNSPYTLMRNNNLHSSVNCFCVVGGDISQYYQDIDITNTINGKPIYYLREQKDLQFDESIEIGYLGLVSCQNITIKNLNLTDTYQGLLLVNTSDSLITNLHFHNVFNCIDIKHSRNNTIRGNNFSNQNNGIIMVSSTNNNIINNEINSNTNDGILLYHSDMNKIIENTITKNKNDGINIQYSNNNNIIGNDVIKNKNSLFFYVSNSNNITNNNLSSNTNDGIYLYASNNNTYLQNNLLKNIKSVEFKKSKNIWYHNYWEKPRLLPKFIFGTILIGNKEIRWFNIDWHPALRPFDIPIENYT